MLFFYCRLTISQHCKCNFTVSQANRCCCPCIHIYIMCSRLSPPGVDRGYTNKTYVLRYYLTEQSLNFYIMFYFLYSLKPGYIIYARILQTCFYSKLVSESVVLCNYKATFIINWNGVMFGWLWNYYYCFYLCDMSGSTPIVYTVHLDFVSRVDTLLEIEKDLISIFTNFIKHYLKNTKYILILFCNGS